MDTLLLLWLLLLLLLLLLYANRPAFILCPYFAARLVHHVHTQRRDRLTVAKLVHFLQDRCHGSAGICLVQHASCLMKIWMAWIRWLALQLAIAPLCALPMQRPAEINSPSHLTSRIDTSPHVQTAKAVSLWGGPTSGSYCSLGTKPHVSKGKTVPL